MEDKRCLYTVLRLLEDHLSAPYPVSDRHWTAGIHKSDFNNPHWLKLTSAPMLVGSHHRVCIVELLWEEEV